MEDYIWRVVLFMSYTANLFDKKNNDFHTKISRKGFYPQRTQDKLLKIHTIKHYLQRWI